MNFNEHEHSHSCPRCRQLEEVVDLLSKRIDQLFKSISDSFSIAELDLKTLRYQFNGKGSVVQWQALLEAFLNTAMRINRIPLR